MKAALRNGGILCSQGNLIFDYSFIFRLCKRQFPFLSQSSKSWLLFMVHPGPFDVLPSHLSHPFSSPCTSAKKGGVKLTCSFLGLGVALAGECQWLHLELIKEMRNFCKTLFPVVEYAYGTIPTYPSGQIGFMLCSKNPVSVPVILHFVGWLDWLFLNSPINQSKQSTVFRWLVTGFFKLLAFPFFFQTRKQISRNQWESCQKKKWAVWILNITTLKFTKHHSSSRSLHER